MAPKKGVEQVTLVNRASTEFDFTNFQIGPLNKKIFFGQLFTESTQQLFNTQRMANIIV